MLIPIKFRVSHICRSPSAEAVFEKIAKDRGVNVEIDSAGIISLHQGETADVRMQSFAQKRGYHLASISRPVVLSDFDYFDMIIGMDQSNIFDLKVKVKNDTQLSKIHLMTDYCTKYRNYNSVPDPYYGGADGFELVLNLLEDACGGLLDYLMKD